jgi:signal peptidase I
MFLKKLKQKQSNNPPKDMDQYTLRNYIEMFLEVILFVFFVNAFLLQTYVIPSSSMENSMLIGDHLLVDKVRHSRSIGDIDRFILPQVEIQRGMIVTFTGPSEVNRKMEPKNLVKRVIGLPGETIRVVGNRVYINGKLIDEPYTCIKGFGGYADFPPRSPAYWHREFPEKFKSNVVDTPEGKAFLIPQGHYFCLGDNRNHSFDSRGWGPLPEDYIVGSPWRVYWSYAATSSEYTNAGFTHKVKDFFRTMVNFFNRTRWERTFKKY